jgi:MscS family membrane protein
VRTFYNSVITIPNARLVNASVDNLGARRYRRLKCMLSLQYDTRPEKIEAFCEGVRELIRRHPYTRKDYYMVYLNQLSDSSLDILLYAFHEAPDWATELRERHRLFVDIIRLAQRLGVEFAFPTRTLHLATAPSGLPAGPPPGREDSAFDSTASAVAGEMDRPEDAVRLGRAEAEAIMNGLWKGEPQPPVTFSDPDRIPPGTSE